MTIDPVPTMALGPASSARAELLPESGGETGFAQELTRAIATEVDRTTASGQNRDVTIRAREPGLAERAGDKIDTLNEERLTSANSTAFEARPPIRSLEAGMADPGAATAQVGAAPDRSTSFDRSMRDLKAAFHHAVEVEIVAKTGSSLNSSMNKLMSGQ